MKQENGKKSKKWLWIVIAVVALLAAVGVALALFLKPPAQNEGPVDETPTSEVYWNIDRVTFTQDSETGLSTREPGEDGLYHFRFASQGQLMDMATADKQIVNYIDTMDAMGLVLDADGLIIDVLDVKTIAVETAKSFYVKLINGNTVTVNSSIAMNGMDVTFEMSDSVYVMDVREGTETLGQPIELDVMDVVCVYGTEETPAKSIFVMQRPEASPLYLRVDRFYSSAEASTTREPDENGVYTIPFAIGGKIEQLKCKDKEIVTGIDSGTDAKQVMGLTFDEEGYINGTIVAATAIRGKVACTVYNVTAINGTSIEATRKLSGSEQGKVVNFNLTENTEIIMNEDGCCHFIGERVADIQMDDRVIVWTDMQNNALYVKVDRRRVEADMYYNFKKCSLDTDKVTTRQTINGYYVFELASKGKVVTVKTKDKALASKIDGDSYQFFGLKVEKGIVKEYYSKDCLTGGYGIGGTTRFVTQVMPTIVQISGSSKFDSFSNYILTPNTEIYDMTQDPGTKVGAKTELKLGDRIIAARDVENNITHIYVLDRYYSGCKLYYNESRKYDSTNKVTTRKLETEGENKGFYVYTMYCEGEKVTVKTDNIDIASAIDAENAPIVAMKVKDGIVKAAYPAIAGIMYSTKRFNYNYVGEIAPDKTVSCYYFSNGERKEASASYKMAANCKIYNVSTNYSKYRGEKATLKLGDQIQAIQNFQTGELTHIWIVKRAMNSPLYMHVNRIAPTNGVTNRIPDANGYYSVDLFFDGQIKTFRTQDKALMSQIDGYSSETFFALEVKGDIILKADSYNASVRAMNLKVSFQDVMKISGKTVTTERMRPGQTNTGATTEFTYTNKTKIYDVSYYSGENRFKPAKLQKGDRISVYADRDGNITYIFILYPHTREDGYISKCSHCGKNVWWEPYTGSFVTTAGDEVVHYYQPADYTRGQGTVGMNVNTATTVVPRFTAVFDMNGKTMTSTARNFLVYYDLVIIDSVGGGVLQANGYNGGNGGNFMVSGGSVTLCDGVTLRQNDAPEAAAGSGGNFIVSNLDVKETGETYVGTVNIKNAKLEAWDCINGGNILLNAGTALNISGGTITGGDIKVAEDAVVKLSGNPKIGGEGIDLRSGAKIAESKLSGDAKVVIQANGIFTEKLSNANAQKAFYEAERKFYPIEVRDSALWTDRDPSKPDYQPEAEVPALPEITKVDNSALKLDANSQAKCPVCNEVVTWTAITDATAVQSLTGGSHYYLPADLTFEKADVPYIQVIAGESACLHLNDHNITATNAIAIQVNGSMNIMGNGIVSGNGYANAELVSDGRPDLHGATMETWNSKAVINVYGGTYVKSAENDGRMLTVNKKDAETGEMVPTEVSGANNLVEVHGNGGTINMFEGATIDARNTKKNAVMTYWGMFNLYGGTVYGGSGAAITGGNWTSTKSGGVSIFGGLVQAGSGAAVTATGVAEGPATLNLYGGEINGGVTYNANAKVTIAGKPVLSRLNVPSKKEGTYEGKIFLGKLVDGASINVHGEGVFTYQCENAQSYLKYFHSLTDVEVVYTFFALGFYEEPVPELPEVPAVMPAVTEDLAFIEGSKWALCPLCKEYVAWKPITQAYHGENAIGTPEVGTHYFLSEDVTYTGTTTFMNAPAGKAENVACVHLNGHKFTATNANFAHGSYGTLNILGSGTVSGNGKSGATITINTNKDFGGGIFLHSGTYTKPASNATGVVQVNGNGGRIMVGKDATIVTESKALAAKVSGGNYEINGTLVINGTVEGGYVESVHALDKGGKVVLELKGANLKGGAKIAEDTKLGLFGETKVSSSMGLDLTSGAKIAASELSGSAKVAIAANGAFTGEKVDVKAQLPYYTNANRYYPIEIKDGALWTEVDPTAPDFIDPPAVPKLPEIVSVDNTALTLDAGSQAKCPVCNKVVTWTAIADATASQVLESGKHYYLSSDLTYEKADLPYIQVESSVSACLHLNDHNITATNAMAAQVFGSLNIMGNGIVSGNGFANAELLKDGRPDLHGATIETCSSGAVLNLYGGTYVKSADNDNRIVIINTKNAETGELVPTEKSGANNLMEVHGNGGTINMFEGATVDARNTKKNAVMTYAGMFNLYGGTVYGGSGTAVTGGNWTPTKSGGVSIYGGLIQAGSGTALTGTGVAEGPAILNIFGGEVNGGVTYNANANVTIAGNPVLSRLNVPSNKEGTYEGKITLGQMTEGASINVSGTGTFTFQCENVEAYLPYFHSVTDFEVVAKFYALAFYEEVVPEIPEVPAVMPAVTENLTFLEGSKWALCPLCKEYVQWIPITQAKYGEKAIGTPAAGAHYYLAEDVTYTGTSTFMNAPGGNNEKVACVHLNGHNFTATNTNVAHGSYGILNILGTGTVSGNGKSGAAITINTNKDFGGGIFLHSGTYTKAADNANGVVQVNSNGGRIVVGKDAKIVTGTDELAAKVSGGNFEINGTLVINGTVEGGYVESLHALDKGGKVVLELNGANLPGGAVIAEDTALTLAGETKIGTLDLTSGAKIADSKLSGAAKVAVAANGAFTGALANVNDQLAFYTNADRYLPVQIKDGALWTEVDPTAPNFVEPPAVPELPEITKVDNSALALDANNQAKCPVCNEVVTWIAITDVTASQVLEDGKHYYLSADVTFEAEDLPYIQVASGVSACLHLNEHNITATKAMAAQVMGTMNIMGNGIVSGNGFANAELLKDGRPDLHGATIETFSSEAVLNLYGGTYVKSADNDNRIVVISKKDATTGEMVPTEVSGSNHIVEVHGNGGTINMFEGATIDARNTKKNAVMTYWGMFNLYGGTVYGGSGTAVAGGNWTPTKSGGVSIYGGLIQAGSGAALNAGGVAEGPAILNLYGGEVIGGTSYNANANVTIAGNPVLSRLNIPTKTEGTYEGKITLGQLTEGASIKVSGTGTFTFQCENVEAYLPYFHSVTDFEVVVKHYALAFYEEVVPEIPEVPAVMPAVTENLAFLEGSKWALCPLCKEYVEWTPIKQSKYAETALGTPAIGGHYYLAEDIAYSGTSVFMNAPGGNAEKVACFHLNGHNFTATNANFAHGSYGVLNILGSGTVSGNGKSGATITINTNKDFGGGIFLHSGNYTKAADNANGVVQINNNGGRIVVGKDAKIVTEANELAAKVAGGNCISGNLIINGTVEGGYVESLPLTVKPDLDCDVIVELNGANLLGGAKIAQDTILGLLGETKIEGLDLTSGAKIAVSELSGTAKVSVKALGAFTDALANVNDQLAFYTNADRYLPVEVKDGALWTNLDPNAPPEPVIPEFVAPPEVPALPELLEVDNSPLSLDDDSKALCPVCNEVVTWVPISSGAETTILEPETHYYLADDITFEGTNYAIAYPYTTSANSKKVTCLHLNNHNITATQARAIFVGNYLNVMGNGNVIGNNSASNTGATLNVNSSAGRLNLYGGTYTKDLANEKTPVAYVGSAGGIMNIFNNVIIDSRGAKADTVSAVGGTINIYGGEIYGGDSGHCVFAGNGKASDNVTVATVNIFGGKIQAKSYSSLGATGTADVKAKLNIYGGTIGGGAVVKSTAEVVIAGNPVMNRLTVNDDARLILGKMTEGASVAILANGEFTCANEQIESYRNYFVPFNGYEDITVVNYALSTKKAEEVVEPTDPTDPVVPSDPVEPTDPTDPVEPTDPVVPEEPAFDNSNLVFAEDSTKAKCPACGEEVEWIAVTQEVNGVAGIGEVAETGFHYYLAEDITYTGTASFIRAPGTDKVACLHLNGHNITSTQAKVIMGYAGTINVMGNGVVSGTGTAENQAATVQINTSGARGVVNLYGGTYTKAADNTVSSVVAIWNNGGKISIYKDAKVVGFTGKPAIYVGTSSLINSVLTIEGATVVGDVRVVTPNEEKGNATTVNLTDAALGNVYVPQKVTCNVAGNTVIGKLIVEDAAKITLGTLGSSAKIDVSGNGVITEANTKIAAYLGNFVSSYGCQLSVQGEALVARDMNKIDNSNLNLVDGKALCPVCNETVEWIALSDATEQIDLLDNKHYYLANDLVYEGTATIFIKYEVYRQQETCLHLNGKNIITPTARAIFSGGYLNVMGTGTVAGGYSSTKEQRGATLDVNSTAARLSLYGGTYTKITENTTEPILSAFSSGGIVNMYGGATIDGTNTTCVNRPGAVHLVGSEGKSAVFNMYGGTIKNGTNNEGMGGNIRVEVNGVFNMYGGVVTEGKATVQYGGNIYSKGALNILGGAIENGNGRIGGNIAAVGSNIVLKNTTISGGYGRKNEAVDGSVAHGGNISIENCTLTIEDGTYIFNGDAGNQGGNVRAYKADIVMNGGSIYGGICGGTNPTANVWVVGTADRISTMRMNGGVVFASENKDIGAGNAISVAANAVLYMADSASVVSNAESANAPVYIANNAKLALVNGWFGSADVKFPAKYEADALIPVASAQVVTVAADLTETVGGTVSGNLQQVNGGVQILEPQADGTIKVAAAAVAE